MDGVGGASCSSESRYFRLPGNSYRTKTGQPDKRSGTVGRGGDWNLTTYCWRRFLRRLWGLGSRHTLNLLVRHRPLATKPGHMSQVSPTQRQGSCIHALTMVHLRNL